MLSKENPALQKEEEINQEKIQKIKSSTNIKYLEDISNDLFNQIFTNMEFNNISGEKIPINDYNDFYNYQINLNSNYNSNIINDIQYKPTQLKKSNEEANSTTISPNCHFVRTSKIINNSESTLDHYNTVIGNKLLTKGIYYYAIKILELGDNTDMCFGIVEKNSEFIKNEKYRNYPLCEFENCFGFNLNNNFYKYNRESIVLSIGTIISIKVNLNKGKMFIYFNGEQATNNIIKIKNENFEYYPAFSLSSGKSIQIKFGFIYDFNKIPENVNKFFEKPICQINNLEKIISCYMAIIDKCLNKIINHNQITFIDLMKYFNPMINIFSQYAFNDEYIMKKYILKYMYKNYYENKEINEFFDEKYNFLYLIIIYIEKNKKQKSILFLLDCLCEEINNGLLLINSNEIVTIILLIKLYNYLLKKNLFKEILFNEENKNENVEKCIKSQLNVIFQSIKIFGISYNVVSYDTIMENSLEKVNRFINNKIYLDCFSELIETLLELKLKNGNHKLNKIDELIKDLKFKRNIEVKNEENKENKKLKNIEIPENYLLNQQEFYGNEKNETNFIKNRNLIYNPYRKIFLDMIKDNLNNKSNSNTYNTISAIIIPLLSIYNHYHDKENLFNYTNEQILSFLPLLSRDNIIFNNFDSIKNIIDQNILEIEMNKKQYNISSFILGFLIFLSPIFEKDLFDIDLILQHHEFRKIVKKWEKKSQFVKENNYIENMKNLILLVNDYNLIVIKKAIESLIPYFEELLNNKFYYFLPFDFIYLLRFFIQFIFYYFYIYKEEKIMKDINTIKLFILFMDINLEFLSNDKICNKYFFNIFDNIKMLYNIISLYNMNYKDLKFLTSDEYLTKLLLIIKTNFEKKDKSYKKYLAEFLMYFNPVFNNDNIGNHLWSDNSLIFFILKEIKNDNNNFWIMTFIIEYLVKMKLILKIEKTENILNINTAQITSEHKRKLKKYFYSIRKIINFIKQFIQSDEVLNKYFNHYITDFIFEKKDKYSIYCYFLNIALLIIKKLINQNLFNFWKNKINESNKGEYKIKYLLNECFDFIEVIFLYIPNQYKNILEKKEKEENSENADKKENRENEELNGDLKHYYIKIINNIKINDITKLYELIEKNELVRNYENTYKSCLRKVIIFLNDIESNYNLIHKEIDTNNDNICPICLDKNNDVHVSPCDHMFCFTCVKKLNNRRCPICRKIIKEIKEHPEFKFGDNDNDSDFDNE